MFEGGNIIYRIWENLDSLYCSPSKLDLNTINMCTIFKGLHKKLPLDTPFYARNKNVIIGLQRWNRPPNKQELLFRLGQYWGLSWSYFNGFSSKGKTIIGSYYASLLNKLKEELRSHLQKKKILFLQDNAPLIDYLQKEKPLQKHITHCYLTS